MKKRIASLLSILLIAVVLIACADNDIDNNKTTVVEIEKQDTIETTDIEEATEVTEIEEDSNIEEATEATEIEEETEATDIEEETDITENDEITISDDWCDMEFIMDNKKYKIPIQYEDFEGTGYYIDLSEYNEEDTTLASKEYVTCKVDLNNDKYGHEINSYIPEVGFINYDIKDKNILDCSIWTIDCGIMYGSEVIKNYPYIKLSKGITWGSSEEQILNAYGEPESIFNSNKISYKVLKFTNRSDDGIIVYNLYTVVNEEYGLVQFKYELYK